ncbi:MAG: hypothetical protein P8Y25_06120 [Chromatiaceae bacterium]
MATLTAALERYLAVRRAFGVDLSTAERALRKFTALADAEGAEHVTVELFLRWKAQYGHADNNTWSARLGMVRGFATWLQGLDPQTEVPPTGLIVGKLRRSKPYIYSDEQIAAIVGEAARLPSAYGLRGWTCATLFGLIATTGLRINCAVGRFHHSTTARLPSRTRSTARHRPQGVLPVRERTSSQRLQRPLQLRSGLPAPRPAGPAALQPAWTGTANSGSEAQPRGEDHH